MRFTRTPRKCPACGGDLEFIGVTRKHKCPGCSGDHKVVLYSEEYLNGVEDAINDKFLNLQRKDRS
jgi:tRNA(Ile2) C34 agmatinyltransferase TiaS